MAVLTSLRARILAVALAPCLAFAGAAGWAVSDQWTRRAEMDRVETLVGLASRISAFVHEAQRERGATSLFLGAKVLDAKVLGAKVLGAKVLGAKVLGAKVLGAKVLGAKVLDPKVLDPKVLGASGAQFGPELSAQRNRTDAALAGLPGALSAATG